MDPAFAPLRGPLSVGPDRDTRSNADRFATVAGEYHRFRPSYPEELFSHIAALCPSRNVALDCATGSGQAATALATRFRQVIAFDQSSEQLRLAPQRDNIAYQQATDQSFKAEPRSVDLVFAANGAHWFDLPKFHKKVFQIAAPGAVVAYIGFNALVEVPDEAVNARDIFHEKMDQHRAEGNQIVKGGYGDIDFPFDEIESPPFEIRPNWRYRELVGFWSTMSPVIACIEKEGIDPIKLFLDCLPPSVSLDDPCQVVIPLKIRLGRVPSH